MADRVRQVDLEIRGRLGATVCFCLGRRLSHRVRNVHLDRQDRRVLPDPKACQDHKATLERQAEMEHRVCRALLDRKGLKDRLDCLEIKVIYEVESIQ